MLGNTRMQNIHKLESKNGVPVGGEKFKEQQQVLKLGRPLLNLHIIEVFHSFLYKVSPFIYNSPKMEKGISYKWGVNMEM